MRTGKRQKSFCDFFQSYFTVICNNSTMHGAKYLVKPGLYLWERLLWLIIMMAAGAVILNSTMVLVTRHVQPMSMSIERDHVNWETFFPVFTLCAQDKVNETALQQFVREKNPRNASEFESFLRSLVNLSFDNLSKGLPESEDAKSLDPKAYLQIIHRLSNHNEYQLTIESRSNLTFPLDSVLTEFGSCYTFNSRALSTVSWKYILTGAKQPDQPVFKTFYAQGDTAATLSHSNERSSFNTYFHSPLAIPTSTSHRNTLSSNSYLLTTFQVRSLDIVTHVKVKLLFYMQRKCLFFYEGQLRHSPHVFSYEMCLRECRIEKMKRICGCLPYFYRLEGADERFCRPEEISCIVQHFALVTNSSENCHCYRSCDDTTFNVVGVTREKSFNGNILRYEAAASNMRYRRDVQVRFWEVLVSFGACSCLFLGITALSITEFFFFYFIHMRRAYRSYKDGE